MLEIKPPTPEEYAVLASKQAHRFPEKYTITLPGNRGEPVKIPVVLGNPSGACKMPLGERPSTAWTNFIASVFRVKDENVGLVREAAADCLLWPEPIVWAQIVERWPGAPDALWEAARDKCGAALSLMDVPAAADSVPAPIATSLGQYERAVWRRLNPPGHQIAIVVDAPKSIAWTFFSDAMKKPDSDRWSLVCEMSQLAIPFAVRIIPATLQSPDVYEEINFVTDVMSRWPGFAVHVAATLSQLAGLGAKVQRDEW